MKRYYLEIDILRLIFALFIFLVHANGAFHNGLFDDGNYAVEFFFMVSGFFMAFHAEHKRDGKEKTGTNCAKYLLSRYLRFLPLLIVGTILGFVYFLIQANGVLSKDMIAYSLIDITCLQMFGFPGNYPSGVAWFFSATLIAIAILYPLLCKWGDNFSNPFGLFIGLILYGLLAHFVGNISSPGEWVGPVMRGTVRGIGSMAIGCFIYAIQKQIRIEKLSTLAFKTITCFKIVCYLALFLAMTFLSDSPCFFPLFPFYIVAVLLSFAGFTFIKETEWIKKIAAFMAKISFPFFVFHFRVISFIELFSERADILQREEDSWVKTAIAFFFAMALSFLYFAIEKAVLKRKEKIRNLFIK